MKEILPIERDKMFYKVSFKSLEQAEMLQKTLSENHEKLFEVISEDKNDIRFFLGLNERCRQHEC